MPRLVSLRIIGSEIASESVARDGSILCESGDVPAEKMELRPPPSFSIVRRLSNVCKRSSIRSNPGLIDIKYMK